MLRNRQHEGRKFRRQVPIGPYFADFCCTKAKLIVELDGSSHDGREEYEALRDASMKNGGWRVIRILNCDLMRDEESFWLFIKEILKKREKNT